MMDNVDGMFGGYAPYPDPQYITTPLKGLSVLGNSVRNTTGCVSEDPRCTSYNQTEVKQTVIGSDLIIVCLGTGGSNSQCELFNAPSYCMLYARSSTNRFHYKNLFKLRGSY